MSKTILGIGAEMRGSSPPYLELSRIGVAMSEDNVFSAYVGARSTSHDEDAVPVSAGDISESAEYPSANHVDDRLVDWLAAHRIAKGSMVPAGWRLTDIGRPQLHSVLPKFAEYLHPHSIELSGLVHAIEGAKTYLGSRRDYSSWEKMARTVASYEILNLTGKPLRASYPHDEALLALLSWRWLRNVMSTPSKEVALATSGGVEVIDGFDE